MLRDVDDCFLRDMQQHRLWPRSSIIHTNTLQQVSVEVLRHTMLDALVLPMADDYVLFVPTLRSTFFVYYQLFILCSFFRQNDESNNCWAQHLSSPSIRCGDVDEKLEDCLTWPISYLNSFDAQKVQRRIRKRNPTETLTR